METRQIELLRIALARLWSKDVVGATYKLDEEGARNLLDAIVKLERIIEIESEKVLETNENEKRQDRNRS